jgi:hypothetical protein
LLVKAPALQVEPELTWSLKSCFWACKASIRQLNDLGGEKMLGNRKQNEINPHPDKDENCSGSRTGDDSGKLRLQMFYQINSSTCFFGKKLTCHQVRSTLNSAKEICPSPSASTSLGSSMDFRTQMPHHLSAETSWVPVLGQGAASLLSQTAMGFSEHWPIKCIVCRHQFYEKYWKFPCWGVFEVYSFQTSVQTHLPNHCPNFGQCARQRGICVASGSTSQRARSRRGLCSPRHQPPPSPPRCLGGAFYLSLLFDERGPQG